MGIFKFLSLSLHDQREFDRLRKTCESEGVKIPTKQQLLKKHEQLQKLADQRMTEVGRNDNNHEHF
jgi:hypothetical protein